MHKRPHDGLVSAANTIHGHRAVLAIIGSHSDVPDRGHRDHLCGASYCWGQFMSLSRSQLQGASSLAAGTVFGLGLAIAQMTNPNKVLSFLDITGHWDASLLFVLGAAVILSAATFHIILRKPSPRFDSRFHLPQSALIDARLVTGAAIFGMGWGIAGYCPGPALASLGFGNSELLWLLPALLLGMALQAWLDRVSYPKARLDSP